MLGFVGCLRKSVEGCQKDKKKLSDSIEYSKKFRNFYGITEKIGCHFVGQKKYFLIGRTKVLTLLSS